MKTASTDIRAALGEDALHALKRHGLISTKLFIKGMAKHPGTAYHYAWWTLQGRFPEGEETIAHNPTFAHRYAKDVLRSRWSGPFKAVAERAIARLGPTKRREYEALPEPVTPIQAKTASSSLPGKAVARTTRALDALDRSGLMSKAILQAVDQNKALVEEFVARTVPAWLLQIMKTHPRAAANYAVAESGKRWPEAEPYIARGILQIESGVERVACIYYFGRFLRHMSTDQVWVAMERIKPEAKAWAEQVLAGKTASSKTASSTIAIHVVRDSGSLRALDRFGTKASKLEKLGSPPVRLASVQELPPYILTTRVFLALHRSGMESRAVVRAVSKAPGLALRYARAVIGGRWPEAEPAIATNARMAVEYACEVIKGRWPEPHREEAEERIRHGHPDDAKRYAALPSLSTTKTASSARLSLDIAHYTRDGRFPQGEPAIARAILNPEDPERHACWIYARDNIFFGKKEDPDRINGVILNWAQKRAAQVQAQAKTASAALPTDLVRSKRVLQALDRFFMTPGIKKAIFSSPKEAMNFAYALGHPVPEGEAIIATSAPMSFLYARHNKAPFPLGEPVMAVGCPVNYATYVLHSRFPQGEPYIAKDLLGGGPASLGPLHYYRDFIAGVPERPLEEMEPGAMAWAKSVLRGGEPKTASTTLPYLEVTTTVLRAMSRAGFLTSRMIKDYCKGKPNPALGFALSVTGPNSTVEQIVASDPKAAARYAAEVLHGRFPAGEAAIFSDFGCGVYYAINACNQRFPVMDQQVAKILVDPTDYTDLENDPAFRYWGYLIEKNGRIATTWRINPKVWQAARLWAIAFRDGKTAKVASAQLAPVFSKVKVLAHADPEPKTASAMLKPFNTSSNSGPRMDWVHAMRKVPIPPMPTGKTASSVLHPSLAIISRGCAAAYHTGLMSKALKAALMTSPELMADTAYSLGERIPEFEPLIMVSPYAGDYARDTIKGRWPEAEAAMAKNPVVADVYAKGLEMRFPAAEPGIADDPSLAESYYAYFIKNTQDWNDPIWDDVRREDCGSCEQCGRPLNPSGSRRFPNYSNPFSDGFVFCSEDCAETNYEHCVSEDSMDRDDEDGVDRFAAKTASAQLDFEDSLCLGALLGNLNRLGLLTGAVKQAMFGEGSTLDRGDAMNAARAYGRRWPELEPLLAPYPDVAFSYAEEVLKGRFPLAEAAWKAQAAQWPEPFDVPFAIDNYYNRFILKNTWFNQLMHPEGVADAPKVWDWLRGVEPVQG